MFPGPPRCQLTAHGPIEGIEANRTAAPRFGAETSSSLPVMAFVVGRSCELAPGLRSKSVGARPDGAHLRGGLQLPIHSRVWPLWQLVAEVSAAQVPPDFLFLSRSTGGCGERSADQGCIPVALSAEVHGVLSRPLDLHRFAGLSDEIVLLLDSTRRERFVRCALPREALSKAIALAARSGITSPR
jgi:hypothetical protein